MPTAQDQLPAAVSLRTPRAGRAALALAVLGLLLDPASGAAQEPDDSAARTPAQAPPAQPGDEEETEPEEEPGGGPIAPPADVEVIRIKGRGVAAIETDVPKSVTQFDAGEIEALGAQNIGDLAKVTPNVEIKTAGSTAATFFIRGVGLSDFSSNAAGAVAIYHDDVAINAPGMQLGTLFDIENVEVLRGPQGTGDNRNASAGAIKIQSRKPSGDLSAELRTSLGKYNLMDFEGAIEAPIVEETLATRLAFRFTERDGYVTNGCAGAPPIEDRFGTDPTVEGWDPTLLFGYNDPPGIPPPQSRAKTATPDPAYRGERFCGENLVNQLVDRTPGVLPGDSSILLGGAYSLLPGGPRPWQPAPDLRSNLNDLGNWAARGTLRFQPPGTEMDWLLIAHGSRTDQLSTVGQVMGTKGNTLGGDTGQGYAEPDIAEMKRNGITGSRLAEKLARNLDIRPYRGDYDRTGDTKLDIWGVSLRGDWTLGPASFTSISAYDTYDRYRNQDPDFTPNQAFENITLDDAWQFYQSLSANGELADVPFSWQVGAYYLMEELGSTIDSIFLGGSDKALRTFTQDVWSYGVYADFAWEFLDDFTLEGGVRWNYDKKDFTQSLERPGCGAGCDPIAQSRTWTAPTATLSLSYRFGEAASVYWKYSRGWKPGTFNSSSQINRALEPAEPETIDAWETGLRGSWLDGRLGLGAALFYYKYVGYQVFVVDDEEGAPPTLRIVNANDAEVYGAEVDLRAEPLAGWVPEFFDGLVLTGRLGWLQSQFLDFTTRVVREIGVPPAPAVVEIDYTGNTLINSPPLKASGSVEWTFDFGRFGSLIPRYDFAWSDDIFFDANEGRGSPDIFGATFLPEYAVGQPPLLLQNVRLAYRTPNANIEIAGWVRNLTDEAYKTYGFDASQFTNLVINFIGEPRTYGIDISIHW